MHLSTFKWSFFLIISNINYCTPTNLLNFDLTMVVCNFWNTYLNRNKIIEASKSKREKNNTHSLKTMYCANTFFSIKTINLLRITNL